MKVLHPEQIEQIKEMHVEILAWTEIHDRFHMEWTPDEIIFYEASKIIVADLAKTIRGILSGAAQN